MRSAKRSEWASTILNNTPLRPPTLRPRLPTEIIDNILSYLSKDSLKPLLVTNSFMSAMSTRRLYHDVILTRPVAIVSFLRTVLANERLPTLVRSLDINITRSKSSSGSEVPLIPGQSPDNYMTKAIPISNFYALLQRALHRMKGLTSLYLELPKTHTPLWIFEGCTFKLRQFTTSIYCRRPLARFLESQDSIVDLTLRGYQTDSMMFLPFIDHIHGPMVLPASEMFVLAPGALPNLHCFNAVHADATLVRAVVEGRPVEVVSIPLFPDMSIPSLDALCLSSTPLKRLSVISFDPSAPDFLFEALARRFTELEALHLVMLMAEYNQELLEQSGVLLSNFKCLKYITFMAAPSSPILAPVPAPAPVAVPSNTNTNANVSNADDSDIPNNAISSTSNTSTDEGTASARAEAGEADIAKQWHRSCPTLRTIILPKGRVWFQGEPEGAGHVQAGAGASSGMGGASGGEINEASIADGGSGGHMQESDAGAGDGQPEEMEWTAL
ncbi:hypothetical protein BDZ97DRAFT_1917758 [Flammula alnicola]|nr:hypothetical protein BDZ97DRAFT_1917758 [Flammula alnicola]